MSENNKNGEFEGKNLEEAVAAAADEYGVSPDDLDVEVVKEPGSLGSLFGRRTVITAALKTGNGFDPVEALTRIVTVIMPEASVTAAENEDQLLLEIVGDGSGIFIGRKGETLDALQFLLMRMAQKQGWQGKRLVVESEKYRERRAVSLREKAQKLADRAKTEHRPQSTELLSAADRHTVHTAVKDVPGVISKSFGQGDLKRVRIMTEDDQSRGGRGRGGSRGGRGGSRGNRSGNRSGNRGGNYNGPPRFED